MGKVDLGIKVFDKTVTGVRSLLHSNPAGKIDPNTLRYMPNIGKSELSLGNSTLGEFIDFAKKVFEEGKGYKPVFENPNTPLAKYLEYIEKANKQKLLLNKAANERMPFKIKFKPIEAITGNWAESPNARLKDFTNYKNFLFDNAEAYGITKEQYQEIADEVARLAKERVMKKSGVRKEIRENFDRIVHWNDIFHTQCQNWSTVNKHKFYDEAEFMQAVEEFKGFVEKTSGKKVLIPTPSRMSLGSSFIGVLNKPENYRDYDYFLISHARGSSLIQDLSHPDAWRFSDDQTIKVWDYIEKNVPRGKRVLVGSCEEHGIELAGKTAEEMVDLNGIKMVGIGNPVYGSGLGSPEGPLKICKSGIRHIIGHANSRLHSDALYLHTSCVNEHIPISDDIVKPVYYNLDFSRFKS